MEHIPTLYKRKCIKLLKINIFQVLNIFKVYRWMLYKIYIVLDDFYKKSDLLIFSIFPVFYPFIGILHALSTHLSDQNDSLDQYWRNETSWLLLLVFYDLCRQSSVFLGLDISILTFMGCLDCSIWQIPGIPLPRNGLDVSCLWYHKLHSIIFLSNRRYHAKLLIYSDHEFTISERGF